MAAYFNILERNKTKHHSYQLKKETPIHELICDSCGRKGASWQNVASDSEINITQAKCLCELCANRITTLPR
jgi:hypothetical protein